MKILIVTQEENVYLPESFGTVCRELKSAISGIVSAPAMSTHGGKLKGFWRHFRLFGVRGTLIMGGKTVFAKLRARFAGKNAEGPWYSIHHVAVSFGIPFFTVGKLDSSDFERLLDQLQPELLISISCPQIIRKKIRDRFPLGCINVHGAPLPKYRGLMPAFWMLLNNETRGAATVHVLAGKLDDGDIIIQRPVPITPEDTWDSMVCKTKAAGASALIEAVHQIENGTAQYRPNSEADASYFSFPTAADARRFRHAGRRFF